eukprot:1161540-Pelagomonas_calceolata.AAC.26
MAKLELKVASSFELLHHLKVQGICDKAGVRGRVPGPAGSHTALIFESKGYVAKLEREADRLDQLAVTQQRLKESQIQ